MNKELLKVLESKITDEEMKKKVLENPPVTMEELVKLASELGIELDFNACECELNDSDLTRISGGTEMQIPNVTYGY